MQGGQEAHWAMFDRVQRAHLTECLNIADDEVLRACAAEVGLDVERWARDYHSPQVTELVERDLARERYMACGEVLRCRQGWPPVPFPGRPSRGPES
jgi:predicted DsbA family dithiol-disulfide isomerase